MVTIHNFYNIAVSSGYHHCTFVTNLYKIMEVNSCLKIQSFKGYFPERCV